MFKKKEIYIINEEISMEDKEKIEIVLSWIPSIIKVVVDPFQKTLEIHSKKLIEKHIIANEIVALGFSVSESNKKYRK